MKKLHMRLKRKMFGVLGVWLLLGLTGCAAENAATEETTKEVDAAEQLSDVSREDHASEVQDRAEDSAPLSPKSGLELVDGTEICGVFDKSREVLHLSCTEKNSENVLYLNGQEQFSVSKEKTIMLYDLAEEDAYLELVVAEPVTVETESEFEASEYMRVNLYRVLPEGLVEIAVLPQGQDNSLLIQDWSSFFSEKGIVLVKGTPGMYRLISQEYAYMLPVKEEITTIQTENGPLQISSRRVAVDQESALGIAFERVYCLMNTAHYNIYRSLDGGISWKLLVEDFAHEAAELEHICIVDESTIICFFEMGGCSLLYGNVVSEDGGLTWRYTKDRWPGLPDKETAE